MNRSGRPEYGDALLNEVGAAFARLRRRTMQMPVEPPISRKDLSRNLVLNVVDEADGQITVGGVADQLSVDPSVASRMVSDCISSGYIKRMASQQDGRQTVLQLTPDGISLRDRFRSQQRQAFEHITKDWPKHEQLELARLLIKYADASGQLSAAGHDNSADAGH